VEDFMDESKKKRSMSDLGFLRSANAKKVIPAAFLHMHSEYIKKNYPLAIPLLDDFFRGIKPSNDVLSEVKKIASRRYSDLLEGKIKEESKQKAPSIPSGNGRYDIQFFVKNVSERIGFSELTLFVDEDGCDTFLKDTFQAAQRYVDRFQAENGNCVFANIRNRASRSGAPSDEKEVLTKISRDESLTRIPGRIKRPVQHRKGSGNSKPFRWTARSRNSHSSFSAG
jgi:hypothetical protein